MPGIGLLEIKLLSFYISIVLIKCLYESLYMNLPIGVVGLTTGVLLFVRDAVLVTLL